MKDSYVEKLKNEIKELKELNKFYTSENKNLKAEIRYANDRALRIEKESFSIISLYNAEIDKLKDLREEYRALIVTARKELARLRKTKK